MLFSIFGYRIICNKSSNTDMRNQLAYLWAANQEIRYDICINTLHTIVRKVFLECFFIECDTREKEENVIKFKR